MKKGMDFTIEFEGVKEDEKWEDVNYLKPIQDAINETRFEITEVGVYYDTKNLVIKGTIIKDTKKEVTAEFTLFKERMKKVLKSYGLKKTIDRMKLHFDTIY